MSLVGARGQTWFFWDGRRDSLLVAGARAARDADRARADARRRRTVRRARVRRRVPARVRRGSAEVKPRRSRTSARRSPRSRRRSWFRRRASTAVATREGAASPRASSKGSACSQGARTAWTATTARCSRTASSTTPASHRTAATVGARRPPEAARERVHLPRAVQRRRPERVRDRVQVTRGRRLEGAFKPPSLRGVAENAPYMHTRRVKRATFSSVRPARKRRHHQPPRDGDRDVDAVVFGDDVRGRGRARRPCLPTS